jgi:outer membrane biosynthesis protein TonB
MRRGRPVDGFSFLSPWFLKEDVMGKVLVVAVAVLAIGLAGCAKMAEEEPATKETVEIRVPDAAKPTTPKVAEPETPKVAKPETPKVTKPETPKVTKPETPKVTKPETPKVTKPEPKVALTELKPGLMAVDLSAVYNSDGIAGADKLGDSDFDEWKQGYPVEAMPKAGLFEPKGTGTAFTFPATDPGKKNNVACAGQTIPLAGKAKALHFLATATGANQEAKVTVTYADGTIQKDLKVTDWCGDAAFGEKIGVESPQRIAVDDAGNLMKEDKKTRIWVVAVPVDAKRELKSVQLPHNGAIHIFALTVAK